MIATAPADVLRFAHARALDGMPCALVTLTGIEGSAPRAIGAQMAVAGDGRYVGSLSGGCIETAIVAEAIETLEAGQAQLVRFGAGSPYLDIRLPCGSGIDLLFNPLTGSDTVSEVLARHERRECAALDLSLHGVSTPCTRDRLQATGWHGEAFRLCYKPALRLIALGQGEELLALARLAAGFGADVLAFSPERRALDALANEGISASELYTRTRLPDFVGDPWTAILFLFHDRDWEEYLLPQALAQESFYIGAIGSQRTQRLRLASLETAGVADQLRNRLRTAVGLIPGTRDPATLALSALSQVVEEYHLMALEWQTIVRAERSTAVVRE